MAIKKSRVVDGDSLQIYASNNISAPGSISMSGTSLVVAGTGSHIAIASGNNLLFQGATATISGVTGSILSLGANGDTINLNISGVTYNVGTLTGSVNVTTALTVGGTAVSLNGHNMITAHAASGLTTGHFLQATGATTFGFAAHGLTATSVGAAPTSHAANASTYGYGDGTNAGHLRLGAGITYNTGTISIVSAAGTADSVGTLTVDAASATAKIGVTLGTTNTTACSGADSRLSNSRTPTAHILDGALHTVSGLTSGHFLKATGTTTFGFGAHGLTYTDVSAAPTSHAANASTYGYGDNTNAGHLRIGAGITFTTGTISIVSAAGTAGSVGTLSVDAAGATAKIGVSLGTTSTTACAGDDSRLGNLTGEVTSVNRATTVTNSAVIGKVLTGYTSGAGTISATDTILQAIQKLNGNDATNANLTGEVTSVGNATTVTNSAVIGKVLTGYTSGAGTVAAADTILQAIQKLNGNTAAHAGTGGTTHAQVTTGVDGFMIAADKSKLDNIAANANNYSHPTGDGNLHVPATSTTNNGKVLTAGASAGSLSWADPTTSFPGGDMTVGSTSRAANSVIRVQSADGYIAGYEAYGAAQGTGYIYVGQDTIYGGGIVYNGDGTPVFANSETSDTINFYRKNNGVNESVFSYPYNSNTVTFNGSTITNGVVRIQSATSNYSEGIRIAPSTTGGYSVIELGADHASATGTQAGQWGLHAKPSSQSYQFAINYNGTDNILVSTAGALTAIGKIESTIAGGGDVTIRNASGLSAAGYAGKLNFAVSGYASYITAYQPGIYSDNIELHFHSLYGNGGVALNRMIVSGQNNWITTANSATFRNAAYNDYAEKFPTPEINTLEPGDILCRNSHGDGYIKVCEAYSKNVVGVYSDSYGYIVGGAKKDSDGNIMRTKTGADIEDENTVPIGLCGRVWVKATGEINICDLLVSSHIPGVAMATDKYIPGTVIGKAMENHTGNSIDRIELFIMNM